jgi:mannose-6-phosphate isomerase-like protein (cupin superfamily)
VPAHAVTVLGVFLSRVIPEDDPALIIRDEIRGAVNPIVRSDYDAIVIAAGGSFVTAADDAATRGAQSRGTPIPRAKETTTMIRKGDMIENPVTGERLLFLETAADTDGERTVVECTVMPNGAVASAHLHPYQTERFEVIAGRVAFKVGTREFEVVPGGEAVVEPGTAHKFWNPGDTVARFRCTVSPSLEFERLIETMFSLAADGKTNTKGLPSPLRLAVIANAHFDDVRLPFPPQWLQKAGLALGAPVGRMLGFGSTYVPRDGAGEPAALGI